VTKTRPDVPWELFRPLNTYSSAAAARDAFVSGVLHKRKRGRLREMTQVTSEEKPKQPLENPELGPKGQRTPYPVDDPIDPKGPGSEPDYFPGKPGSEAPKLRRSSPQRAHTGRRRPRVSWLQAH
jgi:hypothetical protein